MKALAVLAAVAAVPALAAAVSAFSSTSSPAAEAQIGVPPRVLAHYGHIRSLTRKGARYELRFDPAFWLGGVTANRAAEEDGAIRPGEGVPNDYYIRDERKRTLTYLVPANARATIVTHTPRIASTRVPISELAQIVKGRNPKSRKMFGRSLGFWIRVEVDKVLSLDQQYQP